MSSVLRFPDRPGKRPSSSLHFTRAELSRLLNLYSRRVMTGEWRDYAISFSPGMASFFIFRHSMENPLFVISKLEGRGGKGKRTTGRFQVTSRLQKLKQGQSLEDVLAVFDQLPRLVTG